MHPSEAEGFEWDDANALHLGRPRHPIAEWEAEEVFWNGPVWVRNKKAGSGDWKMIGYTDSGRALTIVVEVRPQARLLRVVTGWPCTRGERTRYLRGGAGGARGHGKQ